jgi:aspartate dehydrogenase
VRLGQRIAIIGYGAVAQAVLRHLAPYQGNRGVDGRTVEVQSVLLRSGWHDKTRPEPAVALKFLDDPAEMLALRPELVIECAGQGAVSQYAEQILQAGADLLTISMGAFADESLLGKAKAAALRSGAQIIIPAGAVGGLDVLAAVRHDGIDNVLFRSTKPPRAWLGTPAEKVLDLAKVTDAVCFYRGNAATAARAYPQNANVAAAVALAGAGFERTVIELAADATAAGNVNEIVAEGPFGRFELKMLGKTRPEAPRTSISAPVSIVRAVLNRAAGLVV